MCRMPDSRPMRLVKKWLRGRTSANTSARSRQSTTVNDARCRSRPSSRGPSTDGRSSAVQSPRRSCSSPSPQLLCPATFCWGRQQSELEADDDLQQTIALVGRCHPFRVVQPVNEVDLSAERLPYRNNICIH